MSVILAIVASIIGLGIFYWVWEGIKDRHIRAHIYVVPNKNVFVFSQGNYRIVFDTLTHVPSNEAYMDVNDLYIIGQYSYINNSERDYVALDRKGEVVAVVPLRNLADSRIAVHMPNVEKPTWMAFDDFQQKQQDLLERGIE